MMSRPSGGAAAPSTPQARRNVGKKSVLVTGTSQTRPAATLPGMLTISGTRMPPSYSCPFAPRSGAFDVAGVSGPSLTDRPPLSEVKTTSVFSRSPRSSSLRTTRPTLSSTLCSIAA